ncbi:MAG: entericidin A/B family lipoprotein [Pseudomonadota bacterium]
MKILMPLFSLLLLLSACETIEGAGRDIENTGDAIEDAAHG